MKRKRVKRTITLPHDLNERLKDCHNASATIEALLVDCYAKVDQLCKRLRNGTE